MRNLQNIISIFGNVIVRQGNLLIVSVETLRSLCACFLTALHSYASRLSVELSDATWQWPTGMCGLKPRVRTARCFAMVKQRERRHELMCHRPVA